MPNFGEQLAQQVGSQGANSILGMVFQGWNNENQVNQQKRMNEVNKEMIDYNFGKQIQFWKDTSYGAQKEQMKQAGLNPALMYGMGGGGGQSTGQATTGGGSQAQQGNEIIAANQMGIQYQLLKAQKDNIEADTANKKADTVNKPVLGENIKTQTLDLLQGIDNKKAQEILTRVQTRIAGIEESIRGLTIEDAVNRIKWEAKKIHEEMGQAENETYIQGTTMQAKIDMVNAELCGQLIKNALGQQQETINEAQVKKWATELSQGWAALDQKAKELKLQKWESEIKAQFPGVGQVLGKAMNGLLEGINDIIGGKRSDRVYKTD